MFGINRWWTVAKTLLISGLLLLNLWGCSEKVVSVEPPAPGAAPVKLAGKISEVSPPEVIQELRQVLEKYQPQVTIVSPRAGEVLQDDAVEVRLQVKDLPLYKDESLGLGSHLHVFLDNQPYRAVYDTSQPITFTDLAPGTHTIRVLAGRPWHESFKNDGAYAQTMFHVFTKTSDNNPDPNLPLLTYSRPQGTYGAEPILLDFYLTNAPLHLVAEEDEQDDVVDWRIKVTVNGESFVVDRWQPLYLKGFKPGKNWVQLQYIDEKGNSIQNVYNNTARVFTYEPNGKDTLSKLVRGEISAADARGIVDQNDKPGVPSPAPTPSPEPIPVVPSPVPSVEVTPEPTPTEKPIEDETKEDETKPAISPSDPQGVEPESPAPKGFFNRFRRPENLEPSPEPTPSVTPEPIPTVEPTPKAAPPTESPIPELPVPSAKEAPQGGFFDRFRRPRSPKPFPIPTPDPTPSVSPIPEIEEAPPESVEKPIPELPIPPVKEAPQSGFFDRFRRPERIKPLPQVTPTPTMEPNPEETISPSDPQGAEPAQEPTSDPSSPMVKEAPRESFLDRFRRPETVKPSPTITPDPTPSVEPVPEEAVEPTDSEEPIPELPISPVKETPQKGFFDRLRRPEMPKPSPSTAPEPLVEDPIEAVEKAEPEEAPSLPETQSPETPEMPATKPRSELEKRLGMPLNPPIASPPLKVKPTEPGQPAAKVAEPSNQTNRPVEPAPPETPIELPKTLEAPSDEPIPIPAIQ
ncbi:hypothetical protein ACKFKF_12610 [Phormidesmis sp. 146-12]